MSNLPENIAKECFLFEAKDYLLVGHPPMVDIQYGDYNARYSYDLYIDGIEKFPHNCCFKKFSFFAYITRQFIYRVLARKELNYDNTALGILLKQLDEKNPDRKARHHQFLDKVGRTALDRQITAFITICDGVKNKDEFLKQFNKTFKLDGEQFEFDF